MFSKGKTRIHFNHLLLGCSDFPAPTQPTISFSTGCHSAFSISPSLLITVFVPYRDDDISSAIVDAIHRAFASKALKNGQIEFTAALKLSKSMAVGEMSYEYSTCTLGRYSSKIPSLPLPSVGPLIRRGGISLHPLDKTF